MARVRYRFRSGNVLHEPATGKFYRVERRATEVGTRYLLRSLDSNNPGNLKSGAYIDLQIQDGFLVRSSMKDFRKWSLTISLLLS